MGDKKPMDFLFYFIFYFWLTVPGIQLSNYGSGWLFAHITLDLEAEKGKF